MTVPYSGSAARLMIDREMAAFRVARDAGQFETAWRSLERAHIISQPYFALHVSNHWSMLSFAMRLRDHREIVGQFIRLALAPLGSLTGRIPIGNTGRSNVSAFAPMPIPDDLKVVMKDQQI